MKKWIASALVIGGVLLGSSLLKAEDLPSNNSKEEKKIVQVDKKSHEQAVSRMNEAIKKAIAKTPLYNQINHTNQINPKKEYLEKYENKQAWFGLKKEFNLEDGAKTGASANFYMDQLRKPERLDMGFNYDHASVRVDHNLKNRTGNIRLAVGDKTGLEVILANYKDPIFKAKASLGNVGRVDAYYDARNRDFMSNVSGRYKRAEVNVTWMPGRRALSTTMSYSLPEKNNKFIESIMITDTYMKDSKSRGIRVNCKLGPVKLKVGTDLLTGKATPYFRINFSKKF
jgi:hypothetical protein